MKNYYYIPNISETDRLFLNHFDVKSKHKNRRMEKLAQDNQTLKNKNCRFYKKGSLDSCPYKQTNSAEIDSLYKKYFNKSCKSFSWKRPKCIR